MSILQFKEQNKIFAKIIIDKTIDRLAEKKEKFLTFFTYYIDIYYYIIKMLSALTSSSKIKIATREVKDEIKLDYDNKRQILKEKLAEKEVLLDLDETLKKKIDELRLVFM